MNGKSTEIAVDAQKPLLWVLREDLGLHGPKYGCGVGICGCCSVLVDGMLVRSCVRAVASIADRDIVTIEGLDDRLGNAIKRSWLEVGVAQCGYCQPGQIVAAYALLSRIQSPTDNEVEAHMQNLCRCGTYQRIRTAIARAAQMMIAASPSGSRSGSR